MNPSAHDFAKALAKLDQPANADVNAENAQTVRLVTEEGAFLCRTVSP